MLHHAAQARPPPRFPRGGKLTLQPTRKTTASLELTRGPLRAGALGPGSANNALSRSGAPALRSVASVEALEAKEPALSRPLHRLPAVHGASRLPLVLCAINHSRRKGRARPRPVFIQGVPRTPCRCAGRYAPSGGSPCAGSGRANSARPSFPAQAALTDFDPPARCARSPRGDTGVPARHPSLEIPAGVLPAPCCRQVLPIRDPLRAVHLHGTRKHRGSRSAALHSAPYFDSASQGALNAALRSCAPLLASFTPCVPLVPRSTPCVHFVARLRTPAPGRTSAAWLPARPPAFYVHRGVLPRLANPSVLANIVPITDNRSSSISEIPYTPSCSLPTYDSCILTYNIGDMFSCSTERKVAFGECIHATCRCGTRVYS